MRISFRQFRRFIKHHHFSSRSHTRQQARRMLGPAPVAGTHGTLTVEAHSNVAMGRGVGVTALAVLFLLCAGASAEVLDVTLDTTAQVVVLGKFGFDTTTLAAAEETRLSQGYKNSSDAATVVIRYQATGLLRQQQWVRSDRVGSVSR